jgi:2-iminobutanoate/2-iminopropanoate deaminase
MIYRIPILLAALLVVSVCSVQRHGADEAHGKKEVILTTNSPTPGGPYSQAISAGNLVFLSGQTGVDPASRKLVEGGVEAQAEQVLTNLGAVLKAAGLDYADVVRGTVYLKDMNDYGRVNAVYGRFFPTDPPARVCVEVARIPGDAAVEISLIAAR